MDETVTLTHFLVFNEALGYSDPRLAQKRFQDMHNFHPSYMFNAPEVNNEFNILNDFLNAQLLDDGTMFNGDDFQGMYSDPVIFNNMASGYGVSNGQVLESFQDSSDTQALDQNQVSAQSQLPARAPGHVPPEKAKEAYYMTAADPSGTEEPEKRMKKLLEAKYEAGLLKPFNYVKGYARLNQYMEKTMRTQSKQKISWQLSKFRPRFRERMQSLTDVQLIRVEMWFERTLMEYDRIFAAMSIPACCWRRTGEIFRGNKEMSELIHVPIETFRDVCRPSSPQPTLIEYSEQGKLAIYEVIVEDDFVSYWEKFGSIAFDSHQKAMLTSCTLRNPKHGVNDQGIKCCFSFTIQRDDHNM